MSDLSAQPDPAADPSPDASKDQPMPAQPGAFPPGAAKKSREQGLIIGLAVGVAVLLLLLCGVGATGVVVIMNHHNPPRAEPASPIISVGPPAPAPKVKMAAPNQIGTLVKTPGHPGVEPMLDQMRAFGLNRPFAAMYEDEVTGRITAIGGGTGNLFSAREVDLGVKSFFDEFETTGTPFDVSTGVLEGEMWCVTIDASEGPMIPCAWAGAGGMLAMTFLDVDLATAAQQAQIVLPAVVCKT